MTGQLAGQGDLIAFLKAQGQQRADAAQPEEWRAAVDIRIEALAASGDPFTSDDVSRSTGDSPTGSPGAMGARFSAAVKRGVIRRVGYVPSRRVSVHGHPVALWVGAQREEGAA